MKKITKKYIKESTQHEKAKKKKNLTLCIVYSRRLDSIEVCTLIFYES